MALSDENYCFWGELSCLQVEGDLGLKLFEKLVILKDMAVVGQAHGLGSEARAGLDLLLEVLDRALLGNADRTVERPHKDGRHLSCQFAPISI